MRQKFPNLLKAEPAYKSGDYVRALDIVFKKMDELIDSAEGAKDLREIRVRMANGNLESGADDVVASCTGCTANVVLITEKKLYIANAGDSRAVLCRGGNTMALSLDHKPESAEEERRIVNAGGQITMGRVNGGLNLTRSFGDFDYKRKRELPYDEQMIICKPDVKEIERSGTDEFILMGCDGIWERYVDDSKGLIEMVKNQIAQKKLPQKIMQDLLNALIAKDTRDGIGCDNMTAILIRFQ